MTQALVNYEQPPAMSLDDCILGWINEKAGRSDSKKTEVNYKTTLGQFRSILQSRRLDLDAAPALIAPLAQGFAGFSVKSDDGVAPATFNNRLAALSSFYNYAVINEVVGINPIARVKRRVAANPNAARAIRPEVVKAALAGADRSTKEGKRVYALLVVALATGRRAFEVAGLRYGDLTRDGDKTEVFWRRCKGNKQMRDVLDERVTSALYDHLNSIYPKPPGPDAPVWVSFSDRNRHQAIGVRTLERLCDDILGTSMFHALRHTWALTMYKSGADLELIRQRLGHSNLAITSRYIQDLLSHENPYSDKLADAFGF